MSSRRVSFIVGANVRNFEAAMSSVEKRMHRVGRQATFLGRDLRSSVTIPLVAMGGAILAAAVKTGEFADELLDLSEMTGLSTDSLQEWQNVARTAGVNSDALAKATQSLARRLGDVLNGTGRAGEAFQQLGLSSQWVRENMGDTDKVMQTVIGRLSSMTPGLERASVAGDIFGRQWEQIAPILSMSSEEIAKTRQEAHDLGLVLDGQALESANEFRIEFEKFQAQIKAAGQSMALEFMPVLLELLPVAQDIAESVIEQTKAFMDLDKEMRMNIITWGGIAAAIGPVLILTGSLITSMSKIAGIFKGIAAAGGSIFAAPIVATATLIGKMNTLRNDTNTTRKALAEVLSMPVTGTSDELNDIAQAIAMLTTEIERTKRARALSSIEGREQADLEIAKLEEQIEALIELRHTVATMQIDNFISDDTKQNMEATAEAAAATARSMVIAAAAQAALANAKAETRSAEPTPTVFGMEEFDAMAAAKFEAEQRELWESMMYYAADFSDRLDDVADRAEAVGKNLSGFAEVGVQAFDRLIFQGEKFQNLLRSIARQTALRVLAAGLSGGFSEGAGGLVGGLKRVFNVNDALITSRGDVVNFHPDDNILAMKDFSKLGGSAPSGNLRALTPVHIEINGREVFKAIKEVEYQMR